MTPRCAWLEPTGRIPTPCGKPAEWESVYGDLRCKRHAPKVLTGGWRRLDVDETDFLTNEGTAA